ncbi:MAG: hypothetical protein EBR02_03240 [Alphaproteobacteria bacterium]|nr:hypothetical protein [Alphaproteobacteria bacterium]
MTEKIILFFLISFSSSVAFIGCHVITAFQVDEKNALNKPMILHRYPWIGSLAGFLSIAIFISLFINGWILAEWLGLICLPVVWFATNSVISSLVKYQVKGKHTAIRNPFYQLSAGVLLLFVLTIINVGNV